MSQLSEEISIRLEEIKKLKNAVEKSLRRMPEGRLRISMDKKHPRFYLVTEQGDIAGRYLRRSERLLVEKLAQKDYEKQVLQLLKKEEVLLRQIEEFYKDTCPESFRKTYSKRVARSKTDFRKEKEDLKKELCFYSGPEELLPLYLGEIRKGLIMPVVPDREMFVAEWKAEEYPKKEFYNNDTEYITESGIRVRSKTEWIIAELLEKKGIPFYYEKPLWLSNIGTIHPDFTVLNIRRRKTFFWEHMGLMDNEEYREHALERINSYILNGYYPGVDLILTHETAARPVSTRILEKIVEGYLI